MKTRLLIFGPIMIAILVVAVLMASSVSARRREAVTRPLVAEWVTVTQQFDAALSKPDIRGSDLKPIVESLNRMDGLLDAYVRWNPPESYVQSKFRNEVLRVVTELQSKAQLTYEETRLVTGAQRTLNQLAERWQ